MQRRLVAALLAAFLLMSAAGCTAEKKLKRDAAQPMEYYCKQPAQDETGCEKLDTANPASQAISLLGQYASSLEKPSYDFEEVSKLLTKTQTNQILTAIADTINGEIGAAYQLTDDLYYVVLYENRTISGGALVKRITKGGKTDFRLLSSDATPAEQASLKEAIQEDQNTSNITLSYNEAGGDKAYYLAKALDEMDGTIPNDAAKGEIATYMENAIAEASVISVTSRDNIVKITDKIIWESFDQANNARINLEKALGDVTLNKQVDSILRVACSQLEDGKPVQVIFDSSMLEALGKANRVQVLLGDGQHSVAVASEALSDLCKKYGGIGVQLQQSKEGAYCITFLTPEGEPMDRLHSSMTFTFPAGGELATVLATFGGGVENWGGQYDPINGVLEFSTPYTGEYKITDNETSIPDLADCDEETAAAIRFMVSKGYFSLDTAGAFAPDSTLDRYMFTEALVRMLFALDRRLETTFSDVPADSAYNFYVASGQQEEILEGYGDGKFRGEQEVSREQVLALCSRILVEKKGYRYPDNPAVYLAFEDTSAISNWARQKTALAVRESLVDGSGRLEPQRAITRGEAALILYRLFMLLYETPQAALTVESVDERGASLLTISSGAVAILALAAVIVVILSRRKRRLEEKMTGTDSEEKSVGATEEIEDSSEP